MSTYHPMHDIPESIAHASISFEVSSHLPPDLQAAQVIAQALLCPYIERDRGGATLGSEQRIAILKFLLQREENGV